MSQGRPCSRCGKCGAPGHRRPTCDRVPIEHPDDRDAMLVPLTRGKVAIIDRADADLIRQHRWSAINSHGTLHARTGGGPRSLTPTIFMHRLLLGLPDGLPLVEHLDGDGLNNRRANLRVCEDTRAWGLPSTITDHPDLPGVLLVALGGNGGQALVDAADRHLVEGHFWRSVRVPPIRVSYVETSLGNRRNVSMHRLLCPNWSQVDHVNRDGLDNRRTNLRPSTSSQNGANRRKTIGCSSRFKGVTRTGQRWSASIRVRGKQFYLGSFYDEVAAARAYDSAASEHFGEFACTNEALEAYDRDGGTAAERKEP